MKQLNFNIKDRKVLTLVLCLILVCVFTLTIVYAALSVTLNIIGNAEVVASSWDVHLDNVKVTSGSAIGTSPSITSGTTASFSTTLTTPGDFYEFTIDVVNNGSIDAMIDSVTKEPTLTTAQAKYLKYEVSYQNGESINKKQLVEKDSFVRLKVRVEFRKDITAFDLPTTSETLNLAFTVNYVQSDDSGSGVNNNGVQVATANGDVNEIGTIVTIGNEQFYTIGTEGNNVKLLAMYNLHVGYEAVYDEDEGTIFILISNPTGLQMNVNKEVTTDFSNMYQRGEDYTDYNGSVVESYVNNYKTKIEEFGVEVLEARLITYEELANSNTFACINYSCTQSPYSWIYSTSYWTGTAGTNKDTIFGVYSSDAKIYQSAYHYVDVYGVRPVIVISKSNF